MRQELGISSAPSNPGPVSSPIEDTFKKEELSTLNYIKELLNDKQLVLKKENNYAYMYLKNPQNWLCRVEIQENNWIFTLRKFINTNYECEYYFDEVDQLGQLKEIIQEVYQLCKNY